jgi:hypothetical protein
VGNDQQDSDGQFDAETCREENVKHLEMVQAVINRLASNSFLVKTWSITIATATYGIAVNRSDWRISTIGAFAVLTFWFIDSYFLRQERLFRLLYDYVRSDIRAVPRFSMKTTRFNRRVYRRSVFFSLTLWVLYGMLIIVGIALGIVVHHSGR